ncbi:UV DNA damage repair endonuclease UvsE [Shouchella patagoniensis]|uniref:UV DNA damage repair endonuclease UvsE n=1 Tax=Shouchella patagoniensis TaxID=228576 RepID=UPI000995C774|nr:UV DNA damage repair endonuclease UvsE [Shouchella patagoniensis]
MRLGYACLNTTIPSRFKTCRLQTMRLEGMEKIKELTLHNLNQLKAIVEWNLEYDIRFLRLSSELVPFATHPEMTWNWKQDEDVLKLTNQFKKEQQEKGLRFSMHPGQYSVLNSPKEHVVENAIKDLHYHSDFLDLVNGEDIIIHTGGAYGDKDKAKQAFADVYKTLPKSIKQKLRLENDDKTFHVKDVLEIHSSCGVPICFDIHHERCFHTGEEEMTTLFDNVAATWNSLPKVHISSGKTSKSDRSHANYVDIEDFKMLLRVLQLHDVDVMIEAKAKEKAVLNLRVDMKKMGEI